jgi:D-tyrosyl-tRNA(Tyr) deacylase
MRAILQKVNMAQVSVSGQIVSQIGEGLLVLLGVSSEDTNVQADKLASKIADLRIFADQEGKLNLSISDKHGEILAVSQFTLYADCHKGRRPSFVEAAPGEVARPLYEQFVSALEKNDLVVKTGVFGEHMKIELVNDGPTTIILDTNNL